MAVASLVLLCSVGCAEGAPGDQPVASFGTFADDGAATWVPVPDGQRWCAEVPDPHGCEGPMGGDQVDPWKCTMGNQVDINEQAGGDPRGCACAAPALNEALTDLLVGTEAIVDDDANFMLKFFRDDLYEKAEARCVEIAEGQLSIPPDIHNCEYAIQQALDADPDDFPPLFKDGAFGDCSASGNYWEGTADETGAGAMEVLPSDSYTDYYSVSTDIFYRQSDDTYVIDGDFFNDLVDNPGWLFEDSARVVWVGGGYALDNVGTGTIAETLGLQDDDVPKTLNGYSITTLAGLLAAYEALLDAGKTQFTLVIKRSGSNVTLHYEVR